MGRAFFRFYAELNEFLPPERRFTAFPLDFIDSATVKDRVEALGVPHTEIDLILINGEPADFKRRVADGDRISVYPVFESLDIAPVERLRPEPLRDPRFVLDTHLGRLAANLRMIGFDAIYRNDFRDEELAAISDSERRILLTRDVGLLKRSAVTRGYFVRQTDSRKQLAEVAARFDLARLARPFTRCMRRNALLAPAAKSDVARDLPPRIAEAFSEFQRCPVCLRVYWKGTHYERMAQLINRLRLTGED